MIQNMKYEEIEKVNPFFSIWLSTRDTVRYVIDHKSLNYSLTLAAIAGLPNAISSASELSKIVNISLFLLLICIIVLGPIMSLISLCIGAAIYTWVGKWFGGFGTFKEMVKAMGVMMIPNIWLTPYWVISLIFVRNNLFTMDLWKISTGATIWFLVSSIITLIFSIWMIFIQSKGIGEVHLFSSWKGFATLLIPSILLGAIVFTMMMIFIFFITNSSY